MRFTDEAVEAVAQAYINRDEGENRVPLHPLLERSLHTEARRYARAFLEAARPHLEGATPVADRERMAEVLAENITVPVMDKTCAEIADALLAAGVFREGATPAIDREALEQSIISAANQTKKYEDCTYIEGYTDEIVHAVLALIGGAS